MKKIVLVMACVAILGLATSALAGPIVYLKETGTSPAQTGVVYFPAFVNGINVYVGQYNLSLDRDAAGPLPYVPINGFCIEDAYSTSANNQQYELVAPSLYGTNFKEAAWLAYQWFYNAGVAKSAANAAAIQMAIWDLVMDTDHDATTGAVRTSAGFGAAANTFRNTWLADAGYTNFNPDLYFSLALNLPGTNPNEPPENYQNYIIPKPVPEPATMLLIGSGLVGLAGWGRKKLFKRG